MKYSGKIGYFYTEETQPGLVEEKQEWRKYKGDVIRAVKRDSNGSRINDTISVSNQISIVADAFAKNNFFYIRYVEWQGALWEVTDVDVGQYPRIIISLGGLSHESME